MSTTKALTVPQPVITEVRQLNLRLKGLESKRIRAGLTVEEAKELDSIYAGIEEEQTRLNQQEVDKLAERYSEGRTHNRDGRINFHD